MLLRFLILNLLLLPVLLVSQEPSYKQYLTEDGLPSTTIFKIAQDSKGLMWIATEKGLCSFDGHEFRTYHSEHYQDHNILNLAIDDQDRVWHFNLSGDLFVIKNSKVTPIKGYKYDDYPINEISIHGDLVFLMHNVNGKAKLTVYDMVETDIKLRKELLSNPSNGHASFSSRGDQFFFFEHLDLKTNLYSLDLVTLAATHLYTFTNTIRLISLVDNNRVFAIALDTIYLLNENRELSSIYVGEDTNSIKESQGEYFALSDSGLSYLIVNDNKLVGRESKLSEFEILRACEDSEGCSWLGTRNQGLLFIPNTQSIRYSKENSNLNSNFIRTLTKGNDNTIYVGLNSGKIAKIESDKLFIMKENFGKEVNRILFHKKHMIVGSNEKLTIKDLEDETYYTQGITIKDLELDNNGELLLGTSANSVVAEFIDEKGKITYNNRLIASNRTYAVNSDGKGQHWVGSVNGLYIHNNDSPEIDTILDHNISDIVFSRDNTSYVSTYAQGLYKIVDSQAVRHFNSNESLASNNISNLNIEDDKLYISTDKGLNILDLKTEEMTLLSTSDGIPTNQINGAIPVDSFIWIATSNGLCKIKEPKKSNSSKLISLNLSKVIINDKDTVSQETYKLAADQYSVNLTFSTPEYSSIDYLDYYGRSVNKSDTTWQKLYENKFRIANLAFGETTIQAFAQNRNTGQKSEVVETLFNVRTPLIHQRWFRYLLTLAILAVLFALWTKYITRRHRVEKELLLTQKKMEGFKLTALQNHMNPHFISNSLFTIQDLLDKDKRWRASEFTSHFAELVRHSMHMTTKERISLREELDFLEKYIMLEKMRFENEISSRIIIDDKLKEEADHIFIPPLLVQPLVENVFKHANLGEIENAFVEVSFIKNPNYIKCVVTDNGIGFEKTESVKSKHLKKSTGLKTIEQRLKLNAKHKNNSLNEKALLEIINNEVDNKKTKSVHLIIYYNVEHEPNSYYN